MNEQQLQTIKQTIEQIQNDDARPILVSPMAQVAYDYAPALLAEMERLREALKYYADESKYTRGYTGAFSSLQKDRGKIARNALEREPF